ncbi:MAG TPA: SpoIIE family protein phosphatase [Ktedonobacterales bacterium]
MLAAGQGTATLVFAAQWLIACLLGTAISWALLMFLLRRRLGAHQTAGAHRTPVQRVQRGPLFAALFVAAFGAANLYIEGHAFAQHAPLLAAPAQILFLLLFYLYPPSFPKASYAAHGIRWLGIIYAFAQVAAYIPQQQQQQQQATNPNMHLTPAQVLAIPGVLGWFVVMGGMFALAPIIIGLLPQFYTRARHLAQTGTQAPTLSPARRVLLVIAAVVASIVLFALAGLLAPPALLSPASSEAATNAAFSTVTAAPPVLQAARLGFFLLTSLVPVGAGFLLLNGRRYDREALLHRALIALALVASLLLVYAAGVVAVALVFPGYSGLGYAYLPFILPLAVLLGVIYPPLRAWIEAEIGRRFFHETYEAGQTLAAAGVALRTETSPDQLCAQLVQAVQKALRPSALALWVRPAPGAAAFRASGAFAPAAPPRAVGGHAPEGATASEGAAAPGFDGTQLRWYAQASGSHIGAHAGSQADPSSAPEGAATLTVRGGDLAHLVFRQPSSVIEVDGLPPESPVAGVLHAARVRLALPLISQGELEGVLALAPRAGAHRASTGRPYGEDTRELLASLAGEVAPALRAARISQRRATQTRERERVEQELQTARRIQESLLPKELPALEGWRIATAYQPAREVGGDFYDFITLGDGQLAIVLGDVTDHGIPAALVMATTRSMLRAVAAQPGVTADAVLAQVNELLVQDLPPSMFVTCFYAVLNPASGRLRYANAGQDLPYLRRPDGSVCELRATGMPLGMLPGSQYDTQETTLAPGDGLLFFSDGLVEAHNPAREMFGLPRVMRLLGERDGDTPPIAALLHALADFTGAYWEQEDDITLVALRRADEGASPDTDEPSVATPAPAQDGP